MLPIGLGALVDQGLAVGGIVQRLDQRAVQLLRDRPRDAGRADEAEAAADDEARDAGFLHGGTSGSEVARFAARLREQAQPALAHVRR